MKLFKLSVVFLALFVAIPMIVAACGGGPEERVFSLEVEDRALTQGESTLRVSQGDTVTIELTSDEHVSFHLHGYDYETEVEPGETGTLEFAANATGSFPFTIHVEQAEGESGDEEDHGGDGDHEDEEVDVELGRLEVRP